MRGYCNAGVYVSICVSTAIHQTIALLNMGRLLQIFICDGLPFLRILVSRQKNGRSKRSRVGFFPGKNYFLLSGGKNWKYPEKMEEMEISGKKLCLACYISKWGVMANTLYMSMSQWLSLTGLHHWIIRHYIFCLWRLCLDLQRIDHNMAPINQVLSGKGHGV